MLCDSIEPRSLNTRCYNTVIVALTRADRLLDAFSVFERMLRAGKRPDDLTWKSLPRGREAEVRQLAASCAS